MRWMLLALLAVSALANDGSGESTPAGGVRLRREARISMEKERLTIALDKVTVEYEFLNETSADITTEVLFPLPPYGFQVMVSAGNSSPIRHFRVWAEGRAVPYETQLEALVNGVDFAPKLRENNIDITEFGHFDTDKSDVKRLSKAKREELIRLGLYDANDTPRWDAKITYHWRQTFPARRIVKIRHEYEPVTGLEHWQADDLHAKGQYQVHKPAEFCMNPPLLRTLERAVPNYNGYYEGVVDPTWVDYILTTANTWKMPIKDFELLIRRPVPAAGKRVYISLCWPGNLQTRDANTLVTREKNFVPKGELRVMFVQVGK